MQTARTRIFPASRRFLSTPSGRPAPVTTDATTNLGRQSPGGYGGGGPIPQATSAGGAPPGPTPPPPKKGGSAALPLAVLVLVGAGSAAYYLTPADKPKEAFAHDVKALEQGAKHELDTLRHQGARATSEPLGPTSADAAREAHSFADKLRSPDDRYGAQQVKDSLRRGEEEASSFGQEVKDEVRRFGNKLSSEGESVFGDAKREASRFGSPLHNEAHAHPWKPSLDELKRYRDMLRSPDDKYGYDQVVDAFRGKGVDVTTVGRNPWFDWMGAGHSIRRASVVRKIDDLEREGKSALENAADSVKNEYERAKSAASDFGHEVKSETKSWLNWGSKQAEEAKDKTEAELERAKHAATNEASSWSLWTSAKADEAKSVISSATSSAEHGANSAYNDTASSLEHAKDKTVLEGKSWWNWSGEKAEQGKEGLKEGLLKAERGVEKGAQEAQYQTKKL
ncbi:hypothetical protein Rt10032_c16g5773 [Rhodotorula toruloides]|uniref:Uncharacterized protein n=1 Tax=Rhodotorula toruloides TaxID=5286 RepID=A0A511KPH5_RHOTO|nr:hypothetical protein Rt10032_c16g5773 [Rhodotorula toruloides]